MNSKQLISSFDYLYSEILYSVFLHISCCLCMVCVVEEGGLKEAGEERKEDTSGSTEQDSGPPTLVAQKEDYDSSATVSLVPICPHRTYCRMWGV